MYRVKILNDGEELIIHHPHFNDLKLSTGQIKQGINVAAGFTFSILPHNPGYNLLRPLKTLITVDNMKTGKTEFDGRILMPTESMSDSGAFTKSFVCESELAYLYDSCQRHGEYHNISIRDFLEVIVANHNKDIEDDEIDKKFLVGNVTVTDTNDSLYRYLGYESTLDTIHDKLINRLGGELVVRKENGIRYLDYLAIAGEVKSTEIRLAKNLKSVQKETDPSDIITKLIPLGQTIESEDETVTDASQARLTIASVNDGKDFIIDEVARKNFTIQTKSVNFDDITQPSNLLSAGQAYLRENNRIKVKYSVSALDLSLIDLDTDAFDTGNFYPLINSAMGINETLRVVEKVTDIINPNKNSLTIGDLFKTATQYQNEANKVQDNVTELKNTVTRQTNKIGSISNELLTTKEELVTTKQTLQQTQERIETYENVTDSDITAISQSVSDLIDIIEDIQETVDNVTVYERATQVSDGLMSYPDKIKLDGLEKPQLASFDSNGLMSIDDYRKLYGISHAANDNSFNYYDFGINLRYDFDAIDSVNGGSDGFYYLRDLLEEMARKIDEHEYRISQMGGQ